MPVHALSAAELQQFLLTAALLNYGLLLLWFLLFTVTRDWMRRFHGRWFRLSEPTFDALHYAGMGLYKLAIAFFLLIPWLVLRLQSG